MVEKAPPVVVLPGIMGSELSLDGNVVWPDWRDLLTRPHILHPDDPDGRRLVPTAVVEKVVIVPGIIEMAGYGGLLDFLEKELGYQRGVNLFPFAYDWRQDNRTSARLLARRMTKWRKIVGPDVPFTLIGHSLGGLVARYYVQCLNGHRHVNHVITFGTPHRGAPQGFQSFIQGAYIPVLGTFMTDLIKDVLRACGSTYQILPWGPFVVDPHGQHLDIYADRSWLPAEYQERVDLAHEFQQDLAAAGDFPVLMTCWVGYGQSTLLRVEARPGGLNAWQDLSFTPDHAGGDVSVPEPSAILDGMQDWAHFVSEEHGSLFTHPDAQRWLRHVLTSRRTRALESDAGLESRPAAVIQLVLDQMAYAPAAPILVQVQLLDGERAVPDARVLAHVGDDADAGVILEADPTEEGLYVGYVAAPRAPGNYTLTATVLEPLLVSAGRQRTTYFVVTPSPPG